MVVATRVRISKETVRRAQLAALYETWDENHGGNMEGHFVPGSGDPMARVVLVGDMPALTTRTKGRHKGKPYNSPASKILDELLASIKLSRDEVFVTNVFKWAGSKGHEKMMTEDPTPHLGLLRIELNILNPDIVVTLGISAAKLYFPMFHMPTLAGKVHVKDNRVVVPLYHPAIAVGEPEKLRDMLKHIKAVRQALKGLKKR